MSFRFKLFGIIGTSQVILTLILALVFSIFVNKIKDEPQNKRALELANRFYLELAHKEKTLNNLLLEIDNNPYIKNLLEKGFKDRKILRSNFSLFSEIMKNYDLNVFEIGDKNGKVYFRFHRPQDYGDDKSSQKIIQEALRGNKVSTIELGHSGLALRMTNRLMNMGTILIGQVIDDSFAKQISADKNVSLAIFEKEKVVSISNDLVKNFINGKNYSDIANHSRTEFEDKYLYVVKLPYKNWGLTDLNLEFLILIDETEIQSSIHTLWFYFVATYLFVFSVIFFISYLFSNDIIQSVNKLTYAMENFENDEKKVLDIERKDEIGRIGRVFIRMKEELKIYYNNLEELVNQRTKELNESLHQIQKLKEHQDGDYFLTSLLIKPLSSTTIDSEIIKLETITEQKKTFTFRNKTHEIGGDLNVANQIKLRGKDYVLFMNADAMGKSLQGAGGAIVMGTVFKSIIQNTLEIPSYKDKHPERWLKDCYRELQNVFVSFDGSMLISAFIGLICESTGALYFINSEHPYGILYRDETASFLESDMYIRKIGVEQTDLLMKIQVFQLKEGDSIFLGSDGRDDVLVSTDSSATKTMNSNGDLILQYIERAKGDIQKVKELLKSETQFTDDFTLMKITYKELIIKQETYISEEFLALKNKGIQSFKNGQLSETIKIFKEALVLYPNDHFLLRELAKLCIQTKNYKKASKLCEQYLSIKPSDTDILFYTSFSHRQNKNFKGALDSGERMFLREPEHIQNLLNLTETYFSTGNIKRAQELLTLLTKQEPNNEKVKKLKIKLENYVSS